MYSLKLSHLILLSIVFGVFKLYGIINWPWWAVSLPIWGFFALYLIIAIVIFHIAIVKVIFKK